MRLKIAIRYGCYKRKSRRNVIYPDSLRIAAECKVQSRPETTLNRNKLMVHALHNITQCLFKEYPFTMDGCMTKIILFFFSYVPIHSRDFLSVYNIIQGQKEGVLEDFIPFYI